MRDFSGFPIDLTASPLPRSPGFEECLANGWQLVPSRAQYREPLDSNFLLTAKSNSRTENRRCHCYIVGAMGRVDSKLFRPPTPSHEPAAFLVSPFVHAACYFFPPLSEHVSHPDNARSFFDGGNNDGHGDGGGEVSSLLLSRHLGFDTSTWSREVGKDAEKSVAEMVVSCARADRWSMKPPITRPACRTGDISISGVSLELPVTSQIYPSRTMGHRDIGISIERGRRKESWRI